MVQQKHTSIESIHFQQKKGQNIQRKHIRVSTGNDKEINNAQQK